MKALPIKLSILVFLIGLLSGFYMKIPLLQNLIRASVIYLIFSVLILLIYLMYHQSTYNMLKSQLEREESRHEEIANESSPKPE